MTADAAYQWLVQHSRETAYLKSMGQVLGWDQRTHIPPKAMSTATTSSPLFCIRHHPVPLASSWPPGEDPHRGVGRLPLFLYQLKINQS